LQNNIILSLYKADTGRAVTRFNTLRSGQFATTTSTSPSVVELNVPREFNLLRNKIPEPPETLKRHGVLGDLGFVGFDKPLVVDDTHIGIGALIITTSEDRNEPKVFVLDFGNFVGEAATSDLILNGEEGFPSENELSNCGDSDIHGLTPVGSG
jgi:hypothetical protein